MKPYDDQSAKSSQVRTMFDRIAPRYDLLNHLLSLGVDRGWRRRVVRALRRDSPRTVLDVATGTGDLAIQTARSIPGARVTGVDLSPEMAAIGERKVARQGLAERVEIAVGDASALNFADRTFDAVTCAFGVRNFEDLEGGLREMCRVLRPGGRMAILEFSTPRSKIFAAVYRFYFHRVLPAVGGVISGDRQAYRYLPSSVDEFPAPDEFLAMMRRAGFGDCRTRALSGGIAHLHTGIAK